MKKLLTLSLIVFSFYSASAQKVDSKVARQAAENFWNKSFPGSGNATLTYFLNKQSDTTLFVYNIGNDGFVIVSGDYSVMPVLAWSDEGVFKTSYLAPATIEWLQTYSDQILSCRDNSNEKAKDKGWGELLSDYTPDISNKSSKIVSPLMTTRWDQGKFYNYKCPAYPSGPDGHCVTGCVATAMAQIMKYYNYPEQGVGSHWYSHPHFGNIGADFSATTYDWSSMGNSANAASQEAIGTLIFHCGVSVDMDYSPTESGAMSEIAVTSFKNYFHYRNTIKSESKHYYSEADWVAMLKDNLDQNHPIMYSGSGSGGGHAWVCDGYDASDRFHMNWGWSGSSNGYFLVSNLNPGGYTFNSYQSAIINITPYFAPYCLPSRTFTDSTKVISDGSGYSYYWNDTDCDWLIKPTGAERVMLEFTEFKLEDGSDIMSVYDGETTSDPLLGTFTGYNTPTALTANSGKMLITFNSNSTVQDLGWTAKYWCLKHGDGIKENELALLSVYPNPAINELYIANIFQGIDKAMISLFDYAGKEVMSKEVSISEGKALKLDVEKLDAGFYMVRLQSGQQIYRAKFIKQ